MNDAEFEMIPISEVPLGSEILFGNDYLPATLIGVREKEAYCVIGWKEIQKNIGWPIDHRSRYGNVKKWGRAVANIDEYKYGWNVAYYIEVKYKTTRVVMPNQVCLSCKLPAPHTKPNTDSGFVCKSCQTLLEMQ